MNTNHCGSRNTTWCQHRDIKRAEIRLQPPDALNFHNPDDWPHWRRQFQKFWEASGLAEVTASKQVSTLLYCLGEEAEAVLSSTNATPFNRRNQQSGKLAEQYIMALYSLAENCDYSDYKDEMIHDRFVVGIRDTALAEKMQMDAKLTLETAKKSVRQREAVHEQQRALKGTSDSNLDAICPHRPPNSGDGRHCGRAGCAGDRRDQSRGS